MARYAYERLSAQDASFLWAEQPNQPMHIAALAILESGPMRPADGPPGAVDIERYRQAIEGVLHWIPRYRQKLEWIPVEGWPVWVDDRQFDLGYHIRHIALPQPGSLDQLKELAARITARPLDRTRPLWEIWVIEGVEGGEQFALLNKIHHCMIDGAAGADLSQILLSPSPRAECAEPLPYMPRPAPSRLELIRDALAGAARRPVGLVRRLLEGDPEGGEPVGLDRRVRAIQEMIGYALRPASETPINGELGPHRRFEWLTMPLDDIRELRRVFDCTINDVVLATLCGAMRRYLFRRRVDTRDLDFRVAAPVSTRRSEHDRRQGNHVSTWIVRLPLDLEDPMEQLAAIHEQTERLKESEASLAIETLMEAFEFMPAPVIARSVGLANGPANMICTNVPGPQFPLYMLGARLLGMYPMVPLLPGGGLGVALFSYEGKLCWGFNGDYEILPDLPALVDDIRVSFEALRAAAVARFMARRTGEAEVPVLELPSASGRREAVAVDDADVDAGRESLDDDEARTTVRVVADDPDEPEAGVAEGV